MASQRSDLTLYTYFRSSCSARLRIALNLKEVEYTSEHINLLKGEHQSLNYCAFNPSGLVPSLKLHHDGEEIILTQSVAMLEYLEEILPDRRSLLPPMTDPVGRARVRALVNIVACDIQPVTNLRILAKVDRLGGSRAIWARDLMEAGLRAYETLVSQSSSRFSYGDTVTLADVCLVPAVWGAIRFEVDLQSFPRVKTIYEEMSKEQAVMKAHWQCQPDTPPNLRT